MAWFTRMLTSTIGKKVVMSVTGLFLCTFLVIHLTINSLALVPDGGLLFNEWAHFMGSNVFIRTMEIVLFAGIIIHIIQSLV
ncbi:MAG TPA: succinate dehydrogenase, partial [Chitinophagales bacterium]|nr:succinate dehydrogenase [Chitinophagales bacterium]